jgi:hypothetical protein
MLHGSGRSARSNKLIVTIQAATAGARYISFGPVLLSALADACREGPKRAIPIGLKVTISSLDKILSGLVLEQNGPLVENWGYDENPNFHQR